MKLTDLEFDRISKPPTSPKDPVWVKAFDIYNAGHPEERPLNLNCMPCYYKVYRYIKSIRDEENI